MINYKCDKYPYFTIDERLYPTREQQLNFIQSYLTEYNRLKSIDPGQTEETLLKEANYFALAAHFFWILWAICQAPYAQKKFSFLVSHR
jgi:choline/ethanolamine kinase